MITLDLDKIILYYRISKTAIGKKCIYVYRNFCPPILRRYFRFDSATGPCYSLTHLPANRSHLSQDQRSILYIGPPISNNFNPSESSTIIPIPILCILPNFTNFCPMPFSQWPPFLFKIPIPSILYTVKTVKIVSKFTDFQPYF